MDTLIAKALSFAATKHRDQRRKDPDASPYINHPIAVMTILRVEGNIDDTNTLVAAILHDTLEDTETTYAELVDHFGTKIADIVVEVTDDQDLPRAERYALQMKKTETYSPEARLIRLADKIANTRDALGAPPPAWSQERLHGHLQHSVSVVTLLRGTHEELEIIFHTLMPQDK